MPNLCIFILLSGADHAGRINIQSLSEQDRMDLLFSGFDDKNDYCNTDGLFNPIEEWNGIELDNDGNVSTIYVILQENNALMGYLGQRQPGGSIDLQFIPEKVTDFTVNSKKLHGTVETGGLSKGLKEFDITDNNFTGTFDLCSLPKSIKRVLIQSNDFYGSLDFRGVPDLFQHLNAADNRFSRSIELSALREPLHFLVMHSNFFEGTIDLRKIPKSLACLSLNNNKFSQDVLTVGDISELTLGIHVDTDSYKEIVQVDGKPLRFLKADSKTTFILNPR